jgi:hypothetical protein
MTSLSRRSASSLIAAVALIATAADGHAAAAKVIDVAKQAAAACGPVQPNPPVTSAAGSIEPAVFQVVNSEVLCVKGTFVFESPEKISAIPNPAAIKYLVIDSGGGLVLPAIQLAEMAERYGWLVIVSRSCFSSCGNYVFLSNTDKVVLRGAFVGWHGLPPPPEQVKESFEREFAKPGGAESLAQFGVGFTHDRALEYSMKNATASDKFFVSHGLSRDLASKPPDASSAISETYAEEYRKALAAGNVNWTYSRHALTDRWKVPRILYMWEPANREAVTAAFQKRYGWQLFIFD